MKRNSRKLALLCCLCYGGGDVLMLYGNPMHTGPLIWERKQTRAITVRREK